MSTSLPVSAFPGLLLLLPGSGFAAKPCEYWPYEKLYDSSVYVGEVLVRNDSNRVYFHTVPIFDNLATMDLYHDRMFSPNWMDKAAFKQAIRDELPVKKPRADSKPSNWPLYAISGVITLSVWIALALTQ